MSKDPLSLAQYQLLESQARKLSFDGFRAIQLMRYTSMHVSVIADAIKYDLKTYVEGGYEYISWRRPKKRGREAYVVIRASRNIDFDIGVFIAELAIRRYRFNLDPNPRGRRHRIARTYWFLLVRDIGRTCGLEVSPMTLRHTFGVQSIPILGPELTRAIMNCSEKTFRFYTRHSQITANEVYDRAKW